MLLRTSEAYTFRSEALLLLPRDHFQLVGEAEGGKLALDELNSLLTVGLVFDIVLILLHP